MCLLFLFIENIDLDIHILIKIMSMRKRKSFYKLLRAFLMITDVRLNLMFHSIQLYNPNIQNGFLLSPHLSSFDENLQTGFKNLIKFNDVHIYLTYFIIVYNPNIQNGFLSPLLFS